MGFVFASGRGLEKDARQVLLLNQYDPDTKFYKIAEIEYSINFIAKKCKNVYFVGVFSLGRRVYSSSKHTGFLFKEQAALKEKLFEQIKL